MSTGHDRDTPRAHGDERDEEEATRSVQEENAGTSLDQPSDDSGGE